MLYFLNIFMRIELLCNMRDFHGLKVPRWINAKALTFSDYFAEQMEMLLRSIWVFSYERWMSILWQVLNEHFYCLLMNMGKLNNLYWFLEFIMPHKVFWQNVQYMSTSYLNLIFTIVSKQWSFRWREKRNTTQSYWNDEKRNQI